MKTSRILLVEDEINIAISFSRALQLGLGHGFWVETSLSAEAALYALQKRTFDLLIADHHLPSMPGLDLIQKALQLSPQLKTILMANTPNAQLEAQANQLATIFVAKPVNVAHFVALVHELFHLGKEYHDEA
ncbi:MAG TPA: response regulator [Anaerolineales bacterium]|nr:response regulator [Anaerolineales bacterium]